MNVKLLIKMKKIEYQDKEPSIVNLKVKWKQLFKGEVRSPHTATHAKVPPCGPVRSTLGREAG